MWAIVTDPNFLSALSAVIGPLAFFAAPTEEIERLLVADACLGQVGEDVTASASADLDGLGVAGPIG